MPPVCLSLRFSVYMSFRFFELPQWHAGTGIGSAEWPCFFSSAPPPPPLQVLERRSCDLPVDGDHASLEIRLVVSVSGFKAKGRGCVRMNE